MGQAASQAKLTSDAWPAAVTVIGACHGWLAAYS
jgi:hypothetical protein